MRLTATSNCFPHLHEWYQRKSSQSFHSLPPGALLVILFLAKGADARDAQTPKGMFTGEIACTIFLYGCMLNCNQKLIVTRLYRGPHLFFYPNDSDHDQEPAALNKAKNSLQIQTLALPIGRKVGSDAPEQEAWGAMPPCGGSKWGAASGSPAAVVIIVAIDCASTTKLHIERTHYGLRSSLS